MEADRTPTPTPPVAQAARGRRRGLLAAAAVGALAAGAGLAWRLLRGDDGAPAVATRELPPQLWATRLKRLDGSELELASYRGRPLVLNFWATWCAPCLREMPALERFHRNGRDQGWTVLGIAVDRDDAVREFIRKRPVTYPIALAGWAGVELSRELGNPQGGLPFSAVIDAEGRLARVKLGEADDQEMSKWSQIASKVAK